jgi:hypothetical protein
MRALRLIRDGKCDVDTQLSSKWWQMLQARGKWAFDTLGHLTNFLILILVFCFEVNLQKEIVCFCDVFVAISHSLGEKSPRSLPSFKDQVNIFLGMSEVDESL